MNPQAAPTTGKFVTFEGGEGAGKTTQIERLGTALRKAGIDALITREPGGTPSAEVIRMLLVEGDVGRWQPMTEALLHYAARVEHVAETIKPALSAGKWVVSDRFADSTVAYQGYGHELGAAAMGRLHKIALGGFQPDLTVILDIPVADGLARAGARQARNDDGEDRYERMDEAFHERLRGGFLDIAKRNPERCAVVDATQDAEAVHEWILTLIHNRLGVKVR